jgi:hypothetical protein
MQDIHRLLAGGGPGPEYEGELPAYYDQEYPKLNQGLNQESNEINRPPVGSGVDIISNSMWVIIWIIASVLFVWGVLELITRLSRREFPHD